LDASLHAFSSTRHPAMDAAVKCVTEHPDFASRFRHPVKFNGTDYEETRLSQEEQFREVSKLADGTLHVFLERYGSLLGPSHLQELSTLPIAESSSEVRFWLERFLREPISAASRGKQTRRRRWAWAEREMSRPEGYFSEDEMKRRDPALFHRCVGRFLDSGLRLSDASRGSLSERLMQLLEDDLCKKTTAARDADNDEEMDSDDGPDGEDDLDLDDFCDPDIDDLIESDDEADDAADKPREQRRRDDDEKEAETKRQLDQGGDSGAQADETALRRVRFLRAMRNRFVDGREPGFDYSNLDGDSDLDDMVELTRDAEDRYFEDV